jgi:uncharacterized protein YggE
MEITMNTRFIGWAVALVAVVALGVALVLPRSSAAQNPTTDSRKRITVVGHGEVKITPDVARVTIGVQSEGKDAASALADNNAKMAALIEQIKQAGVAETDIQTSGFAVYPTYNYEAATPQLTGYQVSNTVSVKVGVAGAGDLLDKVVAAGANNVSGISFEVADPAAAQAEARKAAMADAKVRADQFAAAGNGQVGEVLVISELVSQAPVFPELAMADRAEGGNAVPIAPGQQSQTIEIQVTFALK